MTRVANASLIRTLIIFAGGLGTVAATGSMQTEYQRPAPKQERLRGYVAPSRHVELMAPLEDVLQTIEIEAGERVTTGQLLARLDDDLQIVVVEAARLRAERQAGIRLFELDLEEAELNLRRIGQAFQRGAATDVEAQRARIDVERAKAAKQEAMEQLAIDRITLQLEEQRLDRYRLHAPFDGTILEITSEIGALLTSEDSILTLVDLATLEAHLNLPAAMYGTMQVGETYRLRADRPVGTDLAARLKSVQPVIDTASQTFHCTFTIDNNDQELPAGFTVYMEWPQAMVVQEGE